MELLSKLLKKAGFAKPEEERFLNKTRIIGRLWVCAVKCTPWRTNCWHDVSIKEVGIEEAIAFREGIYVKSIAGNPFDSCSPVNLQGYLDRLEYDRENSYWVGFFETEDKAKAAYNELAKKLMDGIASKMS